MDPKQVTAKRPIRYGILYGAGLICFYSYSFIGFGIYQVWDSGIPNGFVAFLRLVLGSFGYLALGIVGGIPVVILSLVLFFRDPMWKQMLNPILASIVVAIFGPVLGPADETLTLLVGLAWKHFWNRFFGQEKNWKQV
jgi:hypothetical protein